MELLKVRLPNVRRRMASSRAKNIKRLRLLLGWGQEDLAKASHTTVRTISSLENDSANPTQATIERVAQALGVSKIELESEPDALILRSISEDGISFHSRKPKLKKEPTPLDLVKKLAIVLKECPQNEDELQLLKLVRAFDRLQAAKFFFLVLDTDLHHRDLEKLLKRKLQSPELDLRTHLHHWLYQSHR